MGGQVSFIGQDPFFLIGIDPGKVTGICIMREKSKSISSLHTLDFWTTYELFKTHAETLIPISQIHIEQPSLIKSLYARHSKRLEETKSEIVTRDKIVWDAGANAREGTLLRDGLRKLGYICLDEKPVGRKKWNAQEFQSAMGWQDRSNQHVRDAAYLIHDKSWQDFLHQ